LPVTLRAKYVGSLALKALRTGNSEIVGQVVNTFPNSFYIKTSTGDLVFVTNRSIRSPITINLDVANSLESIKPLELLHAAGEGVQIGADSAIDLSEASTCQNQLARPNRLASEFTQIKRFLHVASFILSIVDVSQSVMDPSALAQAGIVDFVSDGIILLRRSGMERRFQETALKIVGLGSGFTPSGDDVLGGFLLAYNSFAEAIGRAPVLLESRLLQEKTSWISAKLLDYMQHRIVDEQLHVLVGSVVNENEDAAVMALETLLPRGHTSGIDIAVGAILALSLLRDIALGEKETESIVSRLQLGSPAQR
jgi:hypothetical protein